MSIGIRIGAIIAGALALCAVVSNAAEAPAGPPPEAWRDVKPENLILIDVKYGRIAIELTPWSAPLHVERFRNLVRAKFYDGLSFYRVIDGFVAQGGIGEGTAATAERPITPDVTAAWPALKAEFDMPIDPKLVFTPLGSPDLFAAEVGHIDGHPVGRDVVDGRMWRTHCYGTVAFARDNDPDTATTEFYITIGQIPHRLDRNLSVVGRVIDGMQYVQKLERGDPEVESGVIQQPGRADKIIRAVVASDLPRGERPRYQVTRTESEAYRAMKAERRDITNPFFHHKPVPILDVCLMPIPVRKVQQ
jgi:peptidylprolyl isomerase